jgi:hypothetical protein
MSNSERKNMTRATKRRSILVSVFLAFLCSLVIAVPYAYGYSYVHTETESDASNSGVITICLTVDATEIGGAVTAASVLIPASDNTVDAVLLEGALSSEDRAYVNSYNYDYVSVAQYLSDKEYTVSVFAAGSQNPGAESPTYTSPSIGDAGYAGLNHCDAVYVKVTGA